MIGDLLNATCAAVAGCRYRADHDGKSATYGTMRAAWPGGAIVASYGKLAGDGNCVAHHPVNQSSPAGNLVLLRDPRFRAASHARYRAQIDTKRGVPDAVAPAAVAAAVRREAAAHARMWVGGYDAGGAASALPVRYELLADPAYGAAILADVDAYLGLPRLRGAPLAVKDATALLAKHAYAALAEACGGDRRGRESAPGWWDATRVGCDVDRVLELSRAHAPKTLEALLGGPAGAAKADAAVAENPLLRALWGCFAPPDCATVPRPPNRDACPGTSSTPARATAG